MEALREISRVHDGVKRAVQAAAALGIHGASGGFHHTPGAQ